MQGTSKGRYTFLMLAGVYLMYLGWKLLSGFLSGETTNPVFLISAVLFFIVGVLIIISNIRQIIKMSNEESKANAENSDAEATDVESTDAKGANTPEALEKAAADTASLEGMKVKNDSPAKKSGPSLFDRAGLGSVSDEETSEE